MHIRLRVANDTGDDIQYSRFSEKNSCNYACITMTREYNTRDMSDLSCIANLRRSGLLSCGWKISGNNMSGINLAIGIRGEFSICTTYRVN